MCGISGIISQKNSNDFFISAMVKSQHHRGPDNSNYSINENVALGHNRLAIIDCSDKANQPMSSNDKKIHIVFNGEIYNFKELKKKYFSDGSSSFNTDSDTEIVLKMYEKFGIIAFVSSSVSSTVSSLTEDIMLYIYVDDKGV